MKWLKTVLLKFVQGLVVDSVQRVMHMAVAELNAEIDDTVEDENERKILKSGIDLLHSKVSSEIQERLERL